MSLFLGITQSDLVEVARELWEGRGYVWVENNLVPPPEGFGVWLVEWTTAYELRKLTAKWSRTPATGVQQDHAMITIHLLNLTAGVPDATWTSADYTAAEAAFDAFWTAVKPYYPTSVKLAELHWRADGPAFRPFGSSLAPTLRITPRAVAGTNTTSEMLPPQVALTVTETTAATFVVEDVEGVGSQTRNRWGRFYLPAMCATILSNGRLNATEQANLADKVETMYEAFVTAGLIPVVYSPTTGHSWSVLETHLDDIFDVIRSRRYITPLSRAARAITQV